LKKVRLQALRRQYEVLTMEEEETISQYLDKVMNLSNQMARNGESVIDLMKVEKVLRTLAPRFDHIVVSLEESKDLYSMKIEELQASLEAHELRLTDRIKARGKITASDQALQAQYEKKGNSRKGRNPGLNNLIKIVKVLARIKKGMMKQNLIRRRRKIRRTFNVIIIKRWDIMHLNADQREYQETKMRLSLLEVMIKTLKKGF